MARSTYVTYAFEWGYLNDKIPFIGETKIAEMGKWIEDYLYALCLRLTQSYAQWRGLDYSERLQAHWASGLRLSHVCFGLMLYIAEPEASTKSPDGGTTQLFLSRFFLIIPVLLLLPL